ncbi:putative tetrapyrrole methylase [Mesoplasma florum L1]|uniref:Ribosomal RNA small subunit methyltransferase I n=1 Tax=Mesoplasma florum (strain ATCC 33453 / NBRC 100688 / NCTC 11704 / L1) TaxID=265311 RepID=Q6F214_MESFL|nr:16S rRNA (cytidine(1402)-2'-O)-methyltransferase [Mesoplasma florum]AAT75459.1 putative tetrapyrrole methylase [Mesoplasma florum L1]ATI73060.1 16S rRNA (cytidine(1402)-2'-O)-methyltransferase [Mesoplasma florum]AVN61463.1 16S rRNA (cytidine(1402)-2'-O)-methyltransferase [Mesoplasma florum]
MRNQSTFKNDKPTIYLVGTPIGNLEDISFRALETLKKVSVICCEDTRTSQTFLKKYEINKKLISLHKYNESERIEEIIKILDDKNDVAIISDAGCPAISDPGANFIKEILNIYDCNVTSVNVGPAYIHAIVASGYTAKENYFHGFLENKSDKSKVDELKDMLNKNSKSIISFYESVHRIKDTISKMSEILNSNQSVLIGRELTKLNEQYIQGEIEVVNNFVQSEEFILKGEIVIVVDTQKQQVDAINDNEIILLVEEEIKQGYKLKQACDIVGAKINKSKNEVYQIFIKK